MLTKDNEGMLYIGFSKARPESENLEKRFNAELKQLKNEGKINKTYQKYKPQDTP